MVWKSKEDVEKLAERKYPIPDWMSEQILVKRTENIAINLYAVRDQAGSWFYKNEYNYKRYYKYICS